MSVYVKVEARLDGDEDTLIDAVTWLMRKKFLPKKKGTAFAEIIIDDDKGDYLHSILGKGYPYRDVEEISGDIEFSYEMRKKLGLSEGVKSAGFVSKLESIPTPKGRFENDGVVVELLDKRYWTRGLNSKEFKIVKIEQLKPSAS